MPWPAVAPSSADSPRWWAGDPVVSNGRRGSWRGVSPRGYRVLIPALARTGRHGRDKGVPAGNRPCIAGIPCGGRHAHALPCKPWYNSHWHRCHKAGQYIIEKCQIRICALFDGFYGCLVIRVERDIIRLLFNRSCHYSSFSGYPWIRRILQ